MPIAFDPPAAAPLAALTHRTRSTVDDDAATLDAFTQLLLAAATTLEAASSTEAATTDDEPVAAPPAPPAPADPAAAASVLVLPLPTVPMPPAAPLVVTIVASEKLAGARAQPVSPVSTRTGVIAPIESAFAGAAPAVPIAPSSPRDATPATMPTALALDLPRIAVDPGSAREIDTAATSSNVPQAVAPIDHPETLALPSAAARLAAWLGAPSDDQALAAKPAHEAPVAPLAAIGQAVAPAATVAPMHVDAIAAPAFTPGWQDEAVGKLAHIVLSRHERAELKLNPAELGPVNIRVEMQADHATIMIVAASPDTRSALEQSLPQLRDLLASQGITLGEASVRDHPAQRDGAAQRWIDGGASEENVAGPAAGDTVHVVVRRPDRMVDVFA